MRLFRAETRRVASLEHLSSSSGDIAVQITKLRACLAKQFLRRPLRTWEPSDLEQLVQQIERLIPDIKAIYTQANRRKVTPP